MTRESLKQQLIAMRAQVDALIAGLDALALAPAPAPTLADARDQRSACRHPPAAREQIGGFGAGVGRFRCAACGHVGA